ncbi:MAG: hypothetical protein U0469_01150 [Candidatus Paceibacterota bacterium]|jgi:predicted membrane metal-binding protein
MKLLIKKILITLFLLLFELGFTILLYYISKHVENEMREAFAYIGIIATFAIIGLIFMVIFHTEKSVQLISEKAKAE